MQTCIAEQADGGVAAVGVIGAIRCPTKVCLQTVKRGCHRADHFALGGLFYELRQDRTVANAIGREFHGAAICRRQHHIAPPSDLAWRISVGEQGEKLPTVSRAQVQANAIASHAVR